MEKLEKTILGLAWEALEELQKTEGISDSNRWPRVAAFGKVSAFIEMANCQDAGLSLEAIEELSRIEELASISYRKKQLMVYHNPHTGETIRTRGANHAKLRDWKVVYGDAAVYSWRVKDND